MFGELGILFFINLVNFLMVNLIGLFRFIGFVMFGVFMKCINVFIKLLIK